MKSSIKVLCSLVLAIFSTTLFAQAPVATPNDVASKTDLSRKDKKFLMKASKAGHKEVAVSEAVSSKLTNPAVRDYALMMVTGHTAVNAELAALAARKGVTLAADDRDHRSHWTKKKADDLDEDYIEEMVDDHERTVSLFEKAAKSEDSEIANFAAKTLPSLRQHLTEAERLEEQVD